MDRQILHIDMNNCFASIEMKLRPELKGIPLVVSASQDGRHGIVLAKSEEAKIFNIKTAEPIWMAKKKCKDLKIVEPHYDEYKKHSIWAREIYYSYTNQVEPFSLDEAWLDITGSTKLFGSPLEIANTIRKRIKDELGITVSVGLSFNKIFAKLASDMARPDSVNEIKKDYFKKIVWPMGISNMMGLGQASVKKLNEEGIFYLGDIAKTKKEELEKILGSHGIRIWEQVNGLDNSEVKDFHHLDPIKSISHGRTFIENLDSKEEVRYVFQKLAQKVSRRLIEENLEAMGVQISVKDKDLKLESFQKTLDYSSFSSIVLRDAALDLFKNYKWDNSIRFLELRAINLTKDSNVQTNFLADFKDEDKKSKLDKAIFNLQNSFGKDMIKLDYSTDLDKRYGDEKFER